MELCALSFVFVLLVESTSPRLKYKVSAAKHGGPLFIAANYFVL